MKKQKHQTSQTPTESTNINTPSLNLGSNQERISRLNSQNTQQKPPQPIGVLGNVCSDIVKMARVSWQQDISNIPLFLDSTLTVEGKGGFAEAGRIHVAPEQLQDEHTILHEAAHIVQQRLPATESANENPEIEADMAADKALSGESYVISTATKGRLFTRKEGKKKQRRKVDEDNLLHPKKLQKIENWYLKKGYTGVQEEPSTDKKSKQQDLFSLQQIYALQEFLGQPQTGIFDKNTIQAIAKFQYRQGFPMRSVNGKLSNHPGSQTLKMLSVFIPSFRIAKAQKEGVIGWENSEHSSEKQTGRLIKNAVRYNRRQRFRPDWIRRMQQHLSKITTPSPLKDRSSKQVQAIGSGKFDIQTVRAIGQFQAEQGLTTDGMIGSVTFHLLNNIINPLLGPHLNPMCLVPANATHSERFDYYKNIILKAGGVFDEHAGHLQILAIRGALIKDTGKGIEITRSDSAQKEQKIIAAFDDPAKINGDPALRNHSHFFSDGESKEATYDDLFVSLSKTKDGSLLMKERLGSVDPNLHGHSKGKGTAHLRDGQYKYTLDNHTTMDHADGIRDIMGIDTGFGKKKYKKKDGFDAVKTKGTRRRRRERDNPKEVRYTALRPKRFLEADRESVNEDGRIDSRERAIGTNKLRKRNRDYTSKSIATNIHTAYQHKTSSAGCMNIHPDEYNEFIQEVRTSKNSKNLRFTLIDASKIDLPLK